MVEGHTQCLKKNNIQISLLSRNPHYTSNIGNDINDTIQIDHFE